MTTKIAFFVWILLFGIINSSLTLENKVQTKIEIDPEGYLVFCPCMGRFGNQADQFLGVLAFAKSINRTFVIPHWIEYVPHEVGSRQIPFSNYFEPDAIQLYHKSIEISKFIEEVAPLVWPPEKRIAFCYMERGPGAGCNAKDGNPFGPFWDKFGVDFVGSEIYGPRLHHVTDEAGYQNWKNKYSGSNWPVLAFVGAPSSFPVQEKNIHLQQYIVRNPKLTKQASDYIATLPQGPFVGIHLRNGLDWGKACELVDGSRDLFASPQCTGYNTEHKETLLRPEMCLPSVKTVIKQVKNAVQRIGAKSVFVASDNNYLTAELSNDFKQSKINATVHRLTHEKSPHLDLAILARSTLFIGNCVSSFSAFVKRDRDVHGLPSEFWGLTRNTTSNRRQSESKMENTEL